MKRTILIAALLVANLCTANELQQQYEKAYYLETAKGQPKQAAILYREISDLDPTDENRAVIKQSLMRLLGIATAYKSDDTIQECHEKLLGKTGSTIQELVDATKPGGTIHIPPGRYEGTISIDKPLILKGADRDTCILEATADHPLIFAGPKSDVTIESLTLKSQLKTSERTDPPGCTLVAQDSLVRATNCVFSALGDAKRSPSAMLSTGFSQVDLQGCRFEGYEYAIEYANGAKGSVRDCSVLNPGHCGITVGNGCEVEIVGNIVAGSRYHGVRCTGGNLIVKDNVIIDNRNRGIYLGNKSARGEVSNNVIVRNGAGISAFGSTDVEIANNIILRNEAAGIDTRGSCEIKVENNILAGNKSGFVVYEGGNNRFKIGKNTFWENGQASNDFKLPGSTIEEHPQFKDPDQGNFAVGNSNVASAKQGLLDPAPLAALWGKYKEIVK